MKIEIESWSIFENLVKRNMVLCFLFVSVWENTPILHGCLRDDNLVSNFYNAFNLCNICVFPHTSSYSVLKTLLIIINKSVKSTVPLILYYFITLLLFFSFLFMVLFYFLSFIPFVSFYYYFTFTLFFFSLSILFQWIGC